MEEVLRKTFPKGRLRSRLRLSPLFWMPRDDIYIDMNSNRLNQQNFTNILQKIRVRDSPRISDIVVEIRAMRNEFEYIEQEFIALQSSASRVWEVRYLIKSNIWMLIRHLVKVVKIILLIVSNKVQFSLKYASLSDYRRIQMKAFFFRLQMSSFSSIHKRNNHFSWKYISMTIIKVNIQKDILITSETSFIYIVFQNKGP